MWVTRELHNNLKCYPDAYQDVSVHLSSPVFLGHSNLLIIPSLVIQ